MMFKNRMFVGFFILSLLISSFALLGMDTPQKEEPIKILENPHPFYDAKELDKAFENAENGKRLFENKLNIVFKILSKYAKNQDLRNMLKKYSKDEEIKKLKGTKAKDLRNKIIEEFSQNPFLTEYLDVIKERLNELVAQSTKAPQQGFTTEPTPAAVGTGFLSPTMVVDALGSFIAKRFKEELAIKYLEKFREKLEDEEDKNMEALRLLFPTTLDYLKKMEIYNFKLFLTTLRQFFLNDLNKMDATLIKYFEDNKDKESVLKLDRNKRYMVLISLKLLQSIRNGNHPAYVINELDDYKDIEKLDSKISNPIKLLALVSRNLGNKEGDGWIRPVELKILIKDSSKNMRELFIGLIYAREKTALDDITFMYKDKKDERKSLLEILKDSEKEIKNFNEYIYRIGKVAKDIQAHVESLKKKEKIGFGEYHSFLRTTLDIIEIGFELKEFVKGNEVEKKSVTEYLQYSRDLLEIAQNIHDKVYGVALAKALDLLKDIIPESTAINEILKYGNFIVNMANSQSAEEMGKVLEAAALPVGSYRLKRSNFFSVSLNAYPGGFFGFDHLTTGDKIENRFGGKLGFAAPVGLAFNWGKKSKKTDKKLNTSRSLFISVIDIGAVVSWRISDENTGGLPEFKWKNVFAPGLFYIWGLKDSPIAIGLGVQYGPQLRKIKSATEAEISEFSSLRFGLIVAVDIPIFHFGAKEKK